MTGQKVLYVKKNRFVRKRTPSSPAGYNKVAFGMVRIGIINNAGTLNISLEAQESIDANGFTCTVTSIVPTGNDPNNFVFKLVMATSELLTLVSGLLTWENPFTTGPALYYHPPTVSADDGITFILRGVGSSLATFDTARIFNVVYFATPSLKS